MSGQQSWVDPQDSQPQAASFDAVTETLAAVDVGTNSLHLVVARSTDGGRFEVLTREKEMVRLGSGSVDMRHLDADAVERAVAALGRFRRIAQSYDAPMRAVATSAVREAENRDDLLVRARQEAGVEIEVVSGVEEARLIHLGVLQALDVFDRQIFLCDIGGGSTEMLVGQKGEVLASTSVKLGAVRLTNRFFGKRSMHPSAVDSCRRHVQEMLSSFDREVRRVGFEMAIGSSGTIEQVARIARGLAGEAPLRTLNGATLRATQVDAVVAAAVEARQNGHPEDLPDLEPKRADILLAGALVLEGVMARFHIEELTISEYALREGVFVDTVARHRGGSLVHLRDVARRSVVALMESSDDDPAHSRRVADLALGLFDDLAELHGLGVDARGLLEAAALLANVGLVISHSQHHKHSYYLIRNSDRLVGFTDDEIELVALIARYHRKSAPKAYHPDWADLDEAERNLVRVTAGMLRIAIGLDRAHTGAVVDVRAKVSGGGQVLKVIPVVASTDVDVSLERYAAAERVDLLADALGLEVEIAEAKLVG